MYKKIWKEEQLQDFHAPVEVKRRIQELIDILCFHYGADRSQLLWTETLFSCGSDYAIVLVRPTRTESPVKGIIRIKQ